MSSVPSEPCRRRYFTDQLPCSLRGDFLLTHSGLLSERSAASENNSSLSPRCRSSTHTKQVFSFKDATNPVFCRLIELTSLEFDVNHTVDIGKGPASIFLQHNR